MRNHLMVIAATVIAILAVATLVIAADPSVGTWKLNIAKSTFPPSTEAPPKEETRVKRDVGDQFEITYSGTRTDGSTISSKYTGPAHGGIVNGQSIPKGEMLITTEINPGEVYLTVLQDGKQMAVGHYVVSKDGKTLTTTFKGIDAQGKPYKNVEIWDKQ